MFVGSSVWHPSCVWPLQKVQCDAGVAAVAAVAVVASAAAAVAAAAAAAEFKCVGSEQSRSI